MEDVIYKQLREAANAANIASWGKWESYKPHKGARGYEVKVGAKAVAQHCLKVDAAFIAAANPATVLALLNELEAEQRISSAWRKTAESNRERLEAAEKQTSALFKENVRLKSGIAGLVHLGIRHGDIEVMSIAGDAQLSTPCTDSIIEKIAAGNGVKGE
ncbi:ead/Ea22-like family protein [Citrobacter freundii]|uniref:ead/Ea22-like family protein n=1 Tax=Citrobacter freundii TaxID=546 RepID=UPI00383AFEF0